jgi:hypothetical protein
MCHDDPQRPVASVRYGATNKAISPAVAIRSACAKSDNDSTVCSDDTVRSHIPKSLSQALIGCNGPQLTLHLATKGVGREPRPNEKYVLQEGINSVPVEIESAPPRAYVREHIALELNVLVENRHG